MLRFGSHICGAGARDSGTAAGLGDDTCGLATSLTWTRPPLDFSSISGFSLSRSGRSPDPFALWILPFHREGRCFTMESFTPLHLCASSHVRRKQQNLAVGVTHDQAVSMKEKRQLENPALLIPR